MRSDLEAAHPAGVVAEVHLVAHQLGAVDHGRVVRQLHPLEDVAGRRVVMEEGVEI